MDNRATLDRNWSANRRWEMGGGAISAIATMTMVEHAESTYPDELDEPLGGLL